LAGGVDALEVVAQIQTKLIQKQPIRPLSSDLNQQHRIKLVIMLRLKELTRTVLVQVQLLVRITIHAEEFCVCLFEVGVLTESIPV